MMKSSASESPYWEQKTLQDMSHEEWENLCDGCARCCLHKVEDADSRAIYYTRIACRLLDLETCRCQDYDHRRERVPDCLSITTTIVDKIHWLPESCAYRSLVEGRGLAWWHPLVSGDGRTVKQAGISICGKALTETAAALSEIEDWIVDWFD